MNVYEQVKQALQDVVAPELKSIQVEIKRLDTRIDSLKSEINSRIDSLDNKIDFLKSEIATEIKRLDSKIDSLDDKIDTAIQIRERLAVIEAKLASLEHG